MLSSSTRAEKVPTSSSRKMLYLIQHCTSSSELHSAKVPGEKQNIEDKKKPKNSLFDHYPNGKRSFLSKSIPAKLGLMMWTDPEPCREWLWQPSASSPDQSPPDRPTGAWRELCAELHPAQSTSFQKLRHRRVEDSKLYICNIFVLM